MKPLYSSGAAGLSGELLKELSLLTPWKSLLAIAMQWLLIVSAIALHRLFPTVLVYIPVWLIISGSLYGMYSLLHDAIHYSITRNKRLNDLIGQVFLGFPLWIPLPEMRQAHLDHHRYLQTEKDPEFKHLQYKEFQFPKSRMEWVMIFLGDLSGINFAYYKMQKLLAMLRRPSALKLSDLWPLLLVLVLAASALYLHCWKALLLYWLIPYATLYQLLNRIRLSTEHFHIDGDNPYKTRSVLPRAPFKWLLAPYNLGYHLDHHLYPSVPFYQLPRLHRLLMEHNAEFRAHALVEPGYLSVYKHFIRS